MATKTVKIEGSIKNPTKPLTKSQFDKMRAGTEKKKKKK